MSSTTQTVIRLGNFSDGIADIDPDGTSGAEGAGNLVNQTFDTTLSIETVTYNDATSDGYIDFDGGGSGDNITFDLGSGPQTENVDQAVWYDVDILLGDGSTISTSALIFQTSGGETFMTEFSTSLDNLDIQSITPTGVVNSFFGRMATNNSVSGTTVCFGLGTEILTPKGPKLVETFCPGDSVTTLDGTTRKVKAVHRFTANTEGTGAPVCFAVGSLGNGMPAQTLRVSGNHRIVCASRLVERMFDTTRVFIPAKRFTPLNGVTEEREPGKMEYVHLELSEHSIIFANGALVESCLIGPEAIASLPGLIAIAREQIPEQKPCLPVPKGSQQRQFIKRLIKNGHPVVKETCIPAGACQHAPAWQTAVRCEPA